MNKENYITQLTSQIRNQRARKSVEDEIRTHIEDQTQAYRQQGISKEEAENAAVADMGDPIEVGVSMDMIHRPKMNWKFYGFIVAMGVFSMVLSWILVKNVTQMIATILGLVCMTVVCYLDYTFLGKYAKWICAAFLLFYFLMVWFLPHVYWKSELQHLIHVGPIWVNGATLYAELGPFRFSLWTLMYLYAPIYGAVLFNSKNGGYRQFIKCIILLILPVLTSYHMGGQNSLTISMLLILMIMLTIALVKDWFSVKKGVCIAGIWGITIVLPSGVLAALYLSGNLQSYQLERLKNYFQLDQEYLTTLRISAENYPDFETYTNYLIAYLSQYVSVGISLLLILVLGALIVRVFQISIKQPNQLGQMIGIGCGLVFAVQTAGYVMVNFYLIPPMRSCLPFFSYGGFATVMSYFFLGLILSIYRFQSIPYIKEKKKSRRKKMQTAQVPNL